MVAKNCLISELSRQHYIEVSLVEFAEVHYFTAWPEKLTKKL